MALTRATDKIIGDAAGNLNLSGIITASSFKGDGSGLTGVASTEYIHSSTNAVLSGIVTTGPLNSSTGNFSSDVTISGNLGIAGTITYEDVARVDATGISTFREGFGVGPLAGIALTAYKDGSIRTSGIITASSFVGDGSGLTGAGPSLANGSNNRVVTATGANALTGEANLTFTGSILTVTNSGGASELTLVTPNNTDGGVYFNDGSNAGAVSYLHTDDSMRFRVNSTEKLRIDSSGRLGLKTSAISSYNGSADDVVIDNGAADVGVTLDSETQCSFVFTDSAKTGWDGWIKYVHSDNHLEFGAGASERLRIQADGVLQLTSNTSAQNTTKELRFSPTTSSNRYANVQAINRSGNNHIELQFFTSDADTPAERLRIASGGNIGINDTDPSYKLNVAGDNTASNGTGMLKGIIGVQNNTTAFGSSPTAGISFQTKYRTSPDVPLDVAAIYGGKENTSDADKDGYMGFATREEGGSGTMERMRISSSGYVTTPYNPCVSMNVSSTLINTHYMKHNSVHTNIGNHYNTSTGIFTCPVAGCYYCSVMVMSNNNNQTMDVELHIDGGNSNSILVPYSAATGGSYNQCVGTTILYCDSGDELRFKLNSGSIYQGRHSNITFCLIG